jgi:hypothetical protein
MVHLKAAEQLNNYKGGKISKNGKKFIKKKVEGKRMKPTEKVTNMQPSM